MPKVNVPIGETIVLKLGLRGADYRVQVLDASEDLILVRVPSPLEGGKAVHHVSLEFVTDTYAQWTVPTYVHSVIQRWWYLHRPDEQRCQVLKRRVFPRVSLALDMVAIPINTDLKQEGSPLAVTVLDLSASGCRLATEKLVRERSKFVIVVALPGSEGIPAIAEVVRADGHDGKRYHYGLRFLSLRSDQVEAINAFVEKRIEAVIGK